MKKVGLLLLSSLLCVLLVVTASTSFADTAQTGEVQSLSSSAASEELNSDQTEGLQPPEERSRVPEKPKSVQIEVIQTPGVKPGVSDELLKATRDFFSTQGYLMADSGGDYVVKTSVTLLESEKKFSPLGCLACGIFGAAKPKSKATITTSIVDSDAKTIFNNTTTATSEGSALFGLFTGKGKTQSKAIQECLTHLYSAFLLQYPA